ncbi:MAG: peptide chain release factor 2 [Chloroflexi bacterium]|nr:peptide chain release factor 2 [Chloroflexota bacterium]
MEETNAKLAQMRAELTTLQERLDLSDLETQATALKERSSSPEFWDDSEQAQSVMQELAEIEATLNSWREIDRRLHDMEELAALTELEDDPAYAQELEEEAVALESLLAARRFEVMMSGRHDRANAIVSIYAGAGGTESQDWAEMLLRMYLRWAERRSFASEVIETTEGDEAGIKSATIEIRGRLAFGNLRSERGVHRLVRMSPFDNAHRRHTSFALVEVIPDITGEVSVELNPDDLKFEFYRASGHGGQNVQKNSTAVRITHLPTGVVVSCQNERSQAQNRERALAVLKSRLYDLEEQKKEEELAKLRGEHVTAGWGNQIRSYVLHPYRMVKDLRTGWESGNTSAVLDGDLDGLMEAYLELMVGRN